jgi:predicted SAM-dependent methyltransferase
MGSQYVQYGCGWCAPEGWRSFDASPTLRFERLPLIGRLYTRNQNRFPENVEYGDIVRGLPVPANSCRAVYCSHVLEHLSLHDFRTALQQTYRMLEAGGIFRLVLPDLEQIAREYLQRADAEAAPWFMREASLGKEVRRRGLAGFIIEWAGNSQHQWMWDYKSIKPELELAGFENVRRAGFGDSSDAMFGRVEERGRWENALAVECRKPQSSRGTFGGPIKDQ